ncbi:response regulator [Candidatus Saccharibacteria bacterium]|nr:response regulator [Candidatus Saccharibacteria bacterium]
MSANILLIEPHKLLAQTYAQGLRTAGHSVKWVSQAQAAIQAADHETPDLIILEPQLIKHDGIEFLYEFRSYTEWQRIPVLLHTLVPVDFFRRSQPALERLGVTGYLYKPTTTLRQLISFVQSMPIAQL